MMLSSHSLASGRGVAREFALNSSKGRSVPKYHRVTAGSAVALPSIAEEGPAQHHSHDKLKAFTSGAGAGWARRLWKLWALQQYNHLTWVLSALGGPVMTQGDSAHATRCLD
jgi:hypothetical protein